MAVTTIETASVAHPAQRFGTALKTLLARTRTLIDSFVSYRMQAAVLEAEHFRK